MSYRVARQKDRFKVDAEWNKKPWNEIAPALIGRHMGTKPAHIPRTEVKLAYDNEAVYAIFRVEDRNIRAAAKKHQDCVCTDSCVEFFFAPDTDVSAGYFNLEMNCGGTMLFHFQLVPRQNQVPLSAKDLALIETAHSMPKIVDPEIPGPEVWTVEYRMPFAILEKYRPVRKPAPGVVWMANFFKCADLTSQPHWLTWARVDRPKPDFHVPACFDRLEFA